MRDKIFFASDFHLGIDAGMSSEDREKKIVRWLDFIAPQAKEIYLVGDIFDFWFEYNSVIPRGFSHLLGKLRELRNTGIPITFFTGNHDMWMFDYFEKEYGIPIYRHPLLIHIGNHKFYIGHGDGLGPGDHGYKTIKKIFSNKICQWMFARIHPNLGFTLAKYWSGKSRVSHGRQDKFLGEDKEWLVQYSNDLIGKSKDEVDYFIFGHRHLPIDHKLKNGKCRYINLGEWMYYFSYAVYDGKDIQLQFFENDSGEVFGS